MRTWFAKTVNSAPPQPHPAVNTDTKDAPSAPKKVIRKLVRAPLAADPQSPTLGQAIRIKADIIRDEQKIVLMADRPVLKGYSYWCTSLQDAERNAPLAFVLLQVRPAESILIHDMNVSVSGITADENTARQLGEALRNHLQAGKPAVDEAFLAAIPAEAELRERLQEVIDDEINPGIAAHSGTITLIELKGNTATIKMGGGCQGCAASSITLRQGVEQSFRRAVPHLGALLDETDHAAGQNPFFAELPAGMR